MFNKKRNIDLQLDKEVCGVRPNKGHVFLNLLDFNGFVIQLGKYIVDKNNESIYALGLYYLLLSLRQNHQFLNAAPLDHDAIIIIPYKSSEKQISKMDSFKIDGETAVKQLSSRVSPENIVQTLSNVPEFDILLEGLDAITIGDVYKAAFPNGILRSISEQFLRSPTYENNVILAMPSSKLQHVKKSTEIVATNETKDTDIGSSQNDIAYDDVFEDGSDQEDLKEEPITDDYVYDQPYIEDRFNGDEKSDTIDEDDKPIEDSRDSKNMKPLETTVISHEKGNREVTKYGLTFRDWITKYVVG